MEMKNYYRILISINIPVGYPQYIYNRIDDTKSILLKEGKTIGVATLKYTDLDRTERTTTIIQYNNEEIPSPIQMDFIMANKKIFKDITKEIKRDIIINKFIN